MRPTRSAVVLTAVAGALLLQGVASWAVASASEARTAAPSASAPGSRPLAGSGLQIDDVSCSSARVCTAVGGSALYQPAIFRTTDGGDTWSPQHAPAGMPRITNVSCPTTTFCAAQGDLGAVQNYDYLNFAATLDGGASWTNPTVFVVNGSAGPLVCAAASRCFELGGTGYLERSTDGGSTWKTLYADHWSSVDDIACARSSPCLVVGESAKSQLVIGKLVGYGARLSDITSVPGIYGRNHLRISCATSTWCSAIDYHTSRGAFLTTTDRGSRWVPRALPFAHADVRGYACPRPGVCIALVVTRSATGAAATRILSTRSDGARWTTYPASEPFLSSLSCASSTNCVAVAFDASVVVTIDGGRSWVTGGTI